MARRALAFAFAVFGSTCGVALAASIERGTFEAPAGALLGGDCNDVDQAVHPGQPELVGNLVDDDCDGLADEDANDLPSTDSVDHDGDGISLEQGDCDDTESAIHPAQAEATGNFFDDDCDGLADEDIDDHPSTDALDRDLDGVPIAPDRIFATGFEPAPR
ncbi:MAG TPA: MopE-related protein [Dokdonella sp.]